MLLAENYFEQLLALAPEEATMLGRTGVEPSTETIRPRRTTGAHVAAPQRVGPVGSLEAADATDEVTIHAMRRRLGAELAEQASGRFSS